MHFIFMPYGKRSEVELLLRDMEAQKHFLPFKEGGGAWIQGSIRVLPFGFYEYVFPEEDKDKVLTTLCVEKDRYNLGKFVLGFIRKMIKCEPIPEYKTDTKYLWIKENVNIIPVGVRYDLKEWYDDVVKKNHEAI